MVKWMQGPVKHILYDTITNDFPRWSHEGLRPWMVYLLHWTYGSHLSDQPQG